MNVSTPQSCFLICTKRLLNSTLHIGYKDKVNSVCQNSQHNVEQVAIALIPSLIHAVLPMQLELSIKVTQVFILLTFSAAHISLPIAYGGFLSQHTRTNFLVKCRANEKFALNSLLHLLLHLTSQSLLQAQPLPMLPSPTPCPFTFLHRALL